MIAEFTIENFFSIKSVQKISFEPSADTFMSDEYSYEVKEGVRLLKLGIIYGANASGKTNILNAIEFFKMLVLRMPKDRTEKTGVVPFMLDDTSRNEKTKMSMVFYINQSKYILSFELDSKHIYSETLIVYDSIRPTDERGKLIWAALGPKTIQLVHENISVESVETDEEVLAMDADIIQKFIEGDPDAEKKRRKIEIDLAAIIRKHPDDPRFIALGARMEKLREEHEAGLLTSMEFLKALLELAKDVAQVEKEVVPEEEVDKGKAALTALFQKVKNDNTPIIVERIVNDIDGIVRIVRFPGWQNTSTGRKEVSKNLRDVIMRKYRIKDQEIFAKAYSYVEQYY